MGDGWLQAWTQWAWANRVRRPGPGVDSLLQYEKVGTARRDLGDGGEPSLHIPGKYLPPYPPLRPPRELCKRLLLCLNSPIKGTATSYIRAVSVPPALQHSLFNGLFVICFVFFY